jgi:hypothetical protein
MNRSPCSIRRERAMERKPGHVRFSAVPVAIAFVLGTFCTTLPAWAALYKWTDANGRVVYSDQPPPGNVKVDTIAGPPPPSNPNAAKELAGKEAESRKQQQEAAANAKKAGQQRADAEKRSESCRDSRAELTRLSADQILLYSINEKGETVFMNDSDRRRRRETLESYIKSNCPQG